MAIVGIDLGTTNSLVGMIEKGRPRLFPSCDGKTLLPSYVSFGKDGSIEVGAPAKAHIGDENYYTLYSTKRFLGRNSIDAVSMGKDVPFDLSASDEKMIRFRVGDKTVTPIDTAARILLALRDMAEKGLATKISQAVVTVPAYFNDSQRQATKLAGEAAGLEIVRMINEPTAACLAYGLDKKAQGNIAVFDLGGGTFDISILRVSAGVFEVLATAGDTLLGGDDFDLAIYRHFVDNLTEYFGAPLLQNPSFQSVAIAAAEKVKRDLSSGEIAQYRVEFENQNFTRTLTRQELDSLMQPILDRTAKVVDQCLLDAGLTAAQIADVILAGGSTRSPIVQRFVANRFGREPLCSLNPDEVVAMGAAVQANVLSGQAGDLLLLDVIPLSLGIETMGGVFSRIIHRNSTVPISASQTFTTYVDGQVTVDLHVLQGERELCAENRSLARFQLKGLPPLPAGIPKIEVEFTVDVNGLLNVRAQELRTGTRAAISVSPSFGLSDDEVERMLASAFEHAEADFESRFLAEAQVEAEALVRSAQKTLTAGSNLVEEVERRAIADSIARLTSLLKSKERKRIRSAMEDLNRTAGPLAQKVLNQSLTQALKDKEI